MRIKTAKQKNTKYREKKHKIARFCLRSPWDRMLRVSHPFTCILGCKSAAIGLWSFEYGGWVFHCSCHGVCEEIVSSARSQCMVFHHSLGLDTMLPSAESSTMGCSPHWSVMSHRSVLVPLRVARRSPSGFQWGVPGSGVVWTIRCRPCVVGGTRLVL